MKTEALLEFIYSRRVTRNFEAHAVADEDLWSILEAARWAPAASNLRLHRYVCVTDPGLIERISLVSPGIVGSRPAAIIAICVDRTLPAFDTMEKNYHEYIDAGTAAENMLLAAHALGIGACPATLDSPRAVEKLLNTPRGWTVEIYILFGYAKPSPEHPHTKPRKNVRLEDLVQWGRFPRGDGRAETSLRAGT